MVKKRSKGIFLTLIMIFCLLRIEAQDIKIGLFHDQLVSAFTFHCLKGDYEVFTGEEKLLQISNGDIFFVSLKDNKIHLNNGIDSFGPFDAVSFFMKGENAKFRIKIVDPQYDTRNYTGDLFLSLRYNLLQLILRIGFDEYLAGVVETEGGPFAPIEYHKAQAVLCRTYALKHWERHIDEGFNLCDDVHCQAFKSVCERNPDIRKAVDATYKMVVTDKYSELIIPAYHSNSGGETQRASDIWPTQPEYLQAIVDPFSKNQRNYTWEMNIPMEKWIEYLRSRNLIVEDAEISELLIKQEHRKADFVFRDDTLSMAEIRNDMGFKSSFFNMRLNGNNIIVNGRGYGHGIGMSQEGAMQMAREGYDYSDILRFYFFDVMIKNLDAIPQKLVPDEFK